MGILKELTRELEFLKKVWYYGWQIWSNEVKLILNANPMNRST